jgi:uracil-DNA glycosylase family 4
MYSLNNDGNQPHVHTAHSMRNTQTLSERECTQFPGEAFLHILHQIQHHVVFSQACGMSAVLCESARNIPSTSPTSLEALQKSIDGCQRCRLHARRTHIVFGSGNPRANLMLIGEGPGEHEDLQGVPFVGAAGELLTKILEAIGVKREEVYITNIVKCRPPGNRNPESDEIAACAPFLQQQIALIQPDIICTLGRCATQTLLQTDMPLSRLRGRFHDYGDIRGDIRGSIRLMPTYHPAYLLRYPKYKRAVWEDMQHIQQVYRALVTSTEVNA